MENRNVTNGITPEQLQGMLLDYANALCAEGLRTTSLSVCSLPAAEFSPS